LGAGSQCIITYVPRYDSGSNISYGSSHGFNIKDPPGVGEFPQLFARIVLPVPFVKTNNNVLNVTWLLHFERLTEHPT